MTDPVPFLRGSDHPLYQVAADEIERLREDKRELQLMLARWHDRYGSEDASRFSGSSRALASDSASDGDSHG
jgi:hypothetical protein